MTWTWTIIFVEDLLRHIIEFTPGGDAPSQVICRDGVNLAFNKDNRWIGTISSLMQCDADCCD
jgi:hypothetical protein